MAAWPPPGGKFWGGGATLTVRFSRQNVPKTQIQRKKFNAKNSNDVRFSKAKTFPKPISVFAKQEVGCQRGNEGRREEFVSRPPPGGKFWGGGTTLTGVFQRQKRSQNLSVFLQSRRSAASEVTRCEEKSDRSLWTRRSRTLRRSSQLLTAAELTRSQDA